MGHRWEHWARGGVQREETTIYCSAASGSPSCKGARRAGWRCCHTCPFTMTGQRVPAGRTHSELEEGPVIGRHVEVRDRLHKLVVGAGRKVQGGHVPRTPSVPKVAKAAAGWQAGCLFRAPGCERVHRGFTACSHVPGHQEKAGWKECLHSAAAVCSTRLPSRVHHSRFCTGRGRRRARALAPAAGRAPLWRRRTKHGCCTAHWAAGQG